MKITAKNRKKFQTHFDLKKDPDRAKQAFKNECDINRIMDKAARTGSITHLAAHAETYGDFSQVDENWYEDNKNKIAQWESVFATLPAELRNEFHNDPGEYLSFVTNPANNDRLEEVLPELAKPGRQYPDVIGGGAAEAPAAPSISEGNNPRAEGAESPAEAPSGADSTVT